MVLYDDIIVQHGQQPRFEFILTTRTLEQTQVTVADEDRIVAAVKPKRRRVKIDLPGAGSDFQEYKVTITHKKRVFVFPLAVLFLKQNEPYIVCDIDYTLSATNVFLYITQNILHMSKLEYSSEIVQKISRFGKIIYLTGRVNKFTRMTKMWLSRNNFPDGPLLSRPRGNLFNLDLEAYKKRKLKLITDISTNGVGVGDQDSDIAAYQACELVPIKISTPIIGKRLQDTYTWKNDFYAVKSWKGIERLFDEVNLFKGNDT
jgi:hypothetical protein